MKIVSLISVKHIHVGIELKVYIHINKDVIAPDM